VFEFQDLLQDILKDPLVYEELLQVVISFEQLQGRKADKLRRLPAASLAAVLISGLIPGISQPMLPPLPNHIFTRDIGVAVNQSFFTCIAGKKARKRESILAWFVAHHHPVFTGNQDQKTTYVDLSKNPWELLVNLKDPKLAIEGGDIMLIDKDNLFIGSSLRTNEYSIKKAASIFFEQKVVERITLIEIPKHSNCIHLDTLFTQISQSDFVFYKPFMDGELRIKQFRGDLHHKVDYRNLRELINDIRPGVRFIACGNGRYPYQEREQYASGCNLVALKDGVAVSYARNLKTLEALKERGYQIISAGELLEGIKMGLVDPDKLTNTIITVRSSELTRAGGGPHCLTLPLERR